MIWLACAEPGIREKNIYWTKGGFDLCDNGLKVTFDSHIANHLQRAQLLAQVVQCGRIEIAERQARAALGKFTGQSRANAARGTGEDNYLALEFQRDLPDVWHCSLLCMGCSCAPTAGVMGVSFCTARLAFCAPRVNVKLRDAQRGTHSLV